MICAVDADGTTTAYYEIDDEEQLKKFESFFPGYREFVQSEDNTWGQTRYRIYLCLYAGRTIKLICDGERWGVTFGSLPVNGNLEDYIANMSPMLVRPE